MSALSAAELARVIDHTILRPDAGQAAVEQVCIEALEHQFRAVCVNPVHVPLVASLLLGSACSVCAVAGFPFGASQPTVKAEEAARAVEDGAAEIDMVIDIGALRDDRHEAVGTDIQAVRTGCGGRLLKVIIETCFLSDAQKVTACRIAADHGADFVKTSTGFGGAGATVADVALMRRVVGPALGVKASGGVRDLATARAMLGAGASRLGCSASVAIMAEARAAARG
jgi:deoxyribose-phosphate aldolase